MIPSSEYQEGVSRWEIRVQHLTISDFCEIEDGRIRQHQDLLSESDWQLKSRSVIL